MTPASDITMGEELVRLDRISKRYPGVHALDRATFDLRSGEVHCLIGENGAGKSTLMKILSGAEWPDEGTITVAGRSWQWLDPRAAHELGVATIYQEPDLVPFMTVAENVFLGHELAGVHGGVSRRRQEREAAALLARVGAESISPASPAGTLSIAEQQLVQVAKALSRDSRVLIFDEPGAVLSEDELGELFELIERLAAEGHGIVFISHRLEEVMRIGHRVTVLRDGAVISTEPIAGVSINELIHRMVGREVDVFSRRRKAKRGECLLRVESLAVAGLFSDVSFDVHAGEVVGLAGLVGAGKSSVIRALFGLERPTAGRVLLDGTDVTHWSARRRMRLGFGLVPEDRRGQGLVTCRSVLENIGYAMLSRPGRGPFVNGGELTRSASTLVDKLAIKTAGLGTEVATLSGGNQQKVVFARWLGAGTRVLLLDEPTAGVDVGAKSEIYDIIAGLTADGVGVVLASSQLPELLANADTLLVLAEGAVTLHSQDAPSLTQEQIMRHAVPGIVRSAA